MKPAEALMAARLIARRHGLLLVQVSERSREDARRWEPAYAVYRNRVRLGRRKEPADLLRLLEALVSADVASEVAFDAAAEAAQ